MRRFFLSAGIFALASGALSAQTEQVADSVLLHEVATYAPYKKYQAGAKVESIATGQIEAAQTAGLDELLSRFAPIYLKSNAGGLSTIRLRGTAPDHTSVMFGGININSLTLGHSDFASVPVYLFDNVDLQYGSSSAVNGSGAVGGGVYLGFNSNWTNGTKLNATISEGSFGEQLYGAKVFTGNGKFESVTRAYYFTLKNDFPFTNPDDGKEYTQRGAMIENWGLIQQLNYRFSDRETFNSSLWYQHNWHQIQLLMSEVAQDNTNAELLENNNIRFWSEYENRKHAINYKAGLGYVHDNQLYNADEYQQIGTNRIIAELEARQDFSTKLGYKIGAKYTYINPKVYAYPDVDPEHQADFYLSSFYMPMNRLKLTLNLRQQIVTHYDPPFTPSLGAEYRLWMNETSVLKTTGSIGRSYRIATFNDRYWPGAGNPNILPEDGMNYELGLQYQYCSASVETDVKLNAFYLDVDNWIEWTPTGADWVPVNRSLVVSKGLEFSSNTDLVLNEVKLNVRLNYTFNPTKIKEDTENADLVGRPVLYAPKHMGTAWVESGYRLWKLSVDGNFTGQRLANHTGNIYNPEGEELDAYFLLNAGLTRTLKWRKHDFKLSLACKNLLDKAYYNQPGYAMWGRNFHFTLSSDLNFDRN